MLKNRQHLFTAIKVLLVLAMAFITLGLVILGAIFFDVLGRPNLLSLISAVTMFFLMVRSGDWVFVSKNHGVLPNSESSNQ